MELLLWYQLWRPTRNTTSEPGVTFGLTRTQIQNQIKTNSHKPVKIHLVKPKDRQLIFITNKQQFIQKSSYPTKHSSGKYTNNPTSRNQFHC